MQYDIPLNVVPTSNAITNRRVLPLYLDDFESDIVPDERRFAVVKSKVHTKCAVRAHSPFQCVESAYVTAVIAADQLLLSLSAVFQGLHLAATMAIENIEKVRGKKQAFSSRQTSGSSKPSKPS